MHEQEILHPNEESRLKALKDMQILDTPIEERFERITRLAKKAFNVPVCAISCIDQHRQWFKSIHGLDTTQTPRCISFCQHTILQHDAFVINDARFDDRFDNNPLVTGDSEVVFYAGVPIYSSDGLPVAAFCVLDHEPRSFDDDDVDALRDFAKMVEYELYTSAPNPIAQAVVDHVGESWKSSLVDPLTRLWNHVGLTTMLSGSLDEAKSNQQEICVSIIDFVGFNQVNEQLGHVSGDDLLKWISKDLLKMINEKNVLGRIRGDCFLLITNLNNAQHDGFAELREIHSFLNTYPIYGIEDRDTLGSTIASLRVPPSWGGNVEELLSELDETMYVAKSVESHNKFLIKEVDSFDQNNAQAA
jgi:diguanylate cyclase (GGDEF)-like protein